MSHGVAGKTKAVPLDSDGARAVAECMQVLSTPSRVRILGRLKHGACSVGQLAEAIGMGPSAVSHQLRHLGFVVGERRGKQVIYGLYDPHVAELLDQAIFHVQHLRLGARQPSTAQPRRHEHTHPRARAHARSRPRPWTRPCPSRPGRPQPRLIHRSIKRSHAGLRAVSLSLFVLTLTALAQVAVFVATSSIALLADLIHNFGDAFTAVPLGAAFLLRSFAVEKRAGYFVVATVFISACVAAAEAVNRLINPHAIDHLVPLALAGAIGFIGNEIAAQIRLHAGRNLNSPALIADGNHARTDGFVSLAVVASAAVVALGLNIGDAIIGLAITLVVLRITRQSFQTVRDDPGEDHDAHDHSHPDTAAAEH